MKIIILIHLFSILYLINCDDTGNLKNNLSDWDKLVNCFRRKLGARAIFNHDVRCAAKEMISVFNNMKSVSCKSCDAYFSCQANYLAVNRCGGKPQALAAAIAETECSDFVTSDRQDLIEASDYGRVGKKCSDKYLCKVGCNYDPYTNTCSRTNCR